MAARRKQTKKRKKRVATLQPVVFEPLQKGDRVVIIDSKLAHCTKGDTGIVDGPGPTNEGGWWVTITKYYPHALPHSKGCVEPRTFWFERRELQLLPDGGEVATLQS